MVLDFNNDGAPDLFFVNGAPWPWEESLEKRLGRSRCAFRNDGHGHFTDSRRPHGGPERGNARHGGGRRRFRQRWPRRPLCHLRGSEPPVPAISAMGTLRTSPRKRASAEMTIPGAPAPLWIDFDGDGRLDLIVLHYARWPREVGLGPAFTIADIGRSYGAPTGFVSAFPSVYRNLGNGRFALVPDSAGLRDLDPETSRPVAQPLAIIPLDANGDGRLDLLITYQNHPPALFLSRPDGTFENKPRRRAIVRKAPPPASPPRARAATRLSSGNGSTRANPIPARRAVQPPRGRPATRTPDETWSGPRRFQPRRPD